MTLIRKIIDFTAVHHRQLSIYIGVILLGMMFINVFSGLGTGYIRNWDEARHSISACEMLDTGNYIVNTFNYTTDLWNVKPVLAFYGNLGGILLFGKNIFATRFFSAAAFLLIAAMIFQVLKRTAGTPAAFAGCAAFAVSPTNWVHCYTTGDADAIFILFIFASFLTLWSSLKRGWLLPPAAFFMGLAFLTKSFHIGPYSVLSLFLVAVYWKRFNWIQLTAAIAAGLVPIICWAVLRYYADGLIFFEKMLELDLLKRIKTGTGISEVSPSPWYAYLDRLNHFLLIIPIITIAASLVLGYFFKGKNCIPEKYRAFYCCCTAFFIGIILSYSCCEVKLEWYIWPAIPFLSLVVGMNFQSAAEVVREFNISTGKNKLQVISSGIILLAFLVWFGIGEGKALRVIMTRPPQQDLLLSHTGSKEYFGQSFFSVGVNGDHLLPEQSFILVIRLLSCKIIPGNLNEFKKSDGAAKLICCFGEKTDPLSLQKEASDFARRNDLKLIRCANNLALLQK